MNETIKTINELHTTHGNFNDKKVSKENLDIILQASVKAANASNRQSYAIIVLDNPEQILKLTKYKADKALIYAVDFNRIYDVAKHLGYEYERANDNLFSYLTAHTDVIIAAQTAVIAATSLGIASMFTNSIHNVMRSNIDELYQELNLPEKHFFPITALLLGYEDDKPIKKSGRLLEEIVHYNTYQKLNERQLINLVNKVNDKDNNFGNEGISENYLENYYTKLRAPATKQTTEKIDKMLLDKLKISFLK